MNKDNWAGKVVLVNFWATWCPPCREEIPELLELKKEYKDRLEIVGISEDDDPPENVLKFARQKGMTYPVVMATPELVEAYGGVPALPTSFLIDTQGRVVQKHSGLYPIEAYDLEIRTLLGMPTNARVETFVDTGQVFLRNAANATELPGVSFKGLTAEQKKRALRRLEFGKLHVRLQTDAFAMPGERRGMSGQRQTGGPGREGSCRRRETGANAAREGDEFDHAISRTGFSLSVLISLYSNPTPTG